MNVTSWAFPMAGAKDKTGQCCCGGDRVSCDPVPPGGGGPAGLFCDPVPLGGEEGDPPLYFQLPVGGGGGTGPGPPYQLSPSSSIPRELDKDHLAHMNFEPVTAVQVDQQDEPL